MVKGGPFSGILISPLFRFLLLFLLCVLFLLGARSEVGVNFNQGPFGGHHFAEDLCPPATFEVVPE